MTVLCLALLLAPVSQAGIFDLNADPLNLPKKTDPADEDVREISLLSKPELVELRKLYGRYAELVQKRLDDGWRAGLESGELIEHPEEARLPGRQLEESVAQRETELQRLKDLKAKAKTMADADRLEEAVDDKTSELKKLRRQLARAKGTCADWSDAVWAELLKLKPQGWDLRDGPRQTRPWHTAAIACAPAGAEVPTICLAFDPWKNGAADVYEFDSWDQGSFDGRIAPEFFLHHLPEDEGS